MDDGHEPAESIDHACFSSKAQAGAEYDLFTSRSREKAGSEVTGAVNGARPCCDNGARPCCLF